MNRKKLTYAALSLLAASTLSACFTTPEHSTAGDQTLKLQAPRIAEGDPLLSGFTEATGIRVQLVEDQAAADVAQVIDTGNLHRLSTEGALQSIDSALLAEQALGHLSDLEQGWVGYATRSRIFYYNPEKITHPPTRYADLADPRFQGQLCLGGGTSLYNASLLASLIEHEGEAATEAWIQGVLANLAQPAGGRDSEMLALVAADNACDLTLANHYYFARFALSDDPEHQAIAAAIQPAWPEQEGRGSYQNVAAFALLQTAEQPEAAIRFLEYALSDAAQQQVGSGIFFPVISPSIPPQAEQVMGQAKQDELPLSRVAERIPQARDLAKQANWE